MSSWTYTASNEANLFKIKYGKLIDKQFNEESVVLGRLKKMDDFVGKQIDRPVIQSIGGGVGAGSLPTANENKISLARLNDIKKLYAVVSIDRETMKAAKTDEGSFVRMTKFPVQIAVRSFNRNLERQLIRNDIAGAGSLITGNASNTNVSGAGTSGCPYVVSFDTASTYFPAEFEAIEEGDTVNVNSETTDLVVSAMSVTVADGYATGTVSLVGTSSRLGTLAGSGAFGASDDLYMEGSKDNEIDGLAGVLAATSGTYKNITVGRRWQSYRKDASSAALSTDLLNDLVINVKRQSGASPKMLLMHYHQYIKLLNILEDQKHYNLPARDKRFKGQISFSGIEFLSADGVIPVFSSRFMDSNKVYALNDDHMELHCRPGGFEWFDEDGTVFLRESTDSYEARYGGYCEFYVNPHFQGELHSLSV
jgi:hypothetical protein